MKGGVVKEGKEQKKKRETTSTNLRDKRLVSKAARPTNASKKTLTTTLQVCHLLLKVLIRVSMASIVS